MRVVGVDFGQRRIGLALSDATATLARPWKTVSAGATPEASAAVVAAELDALRKSDEDAADLKLVIVGVPRRLNGEDSDQTKPARAFIEALRARISAHVHEQDERLTSHEADRLLAAHEQDWRRRKAQLDAASAAVILQEYLDTRPQAEARSSS